MLDTLEAARAGDPDAFATLVAPHRRELRAHCYRFSGSLQDADDLLQEVLLRAWRGLAGFEGRSSLRTWLYRVATHTCLDALESRSARVLPESLGPAGAPDDIAPPRLDVSWLEPCPASLYADGPEAAITSRQSVALAFLVALQALPARQRAVLLLREVVGWEASECAAALDLSVAAVNSLTQRARETLASRRALAADPPPVPDELLARYVHAWEQADVGALVSVLREDATLAMPPIPTWLQGSAAIGASIRAMVLPPEAAGRFRLVRTEANGRLAFAAYALDPATGGFHLAALHVLETDGAAITGILAFAHPALFGAFGLPPSL